jgi:Ctr copper transporter family
MQTICAHFALLAHRHNPTMAHSHASVAAVDAAAVAAPQHGLCQGMPMAMYMDGFHSTLGRGSQSLHCLNFLLPSWILATRQDLYGALVWTFGLAVSVEGLNALRVLARRRLMPKSSLSGREMQASRQRLCVQSILTCLYGLQLWLGYLLMFLAMSYSVEVTVSLIAGLTCGHVLFFSYSTALDEESV